MDHRIVISEFVGVVVSTSDEKKALYSPPHIDPKIRGLKQSFLVEHPFTFSFSCILHLYCNCICISIESKFVSKINFYHIYELCAIIQGVCYMGRRGVRESRGGRWPTIIPALYLCCICICIVF